VKLYNNIYSIIHLPFELQRRGIEVQYPQSITSEKGIEKQKIYMCIYVLILHTQETDKHILKVSYILTVNVKHKWCRVQLVQ